MADQDAETIKVLFYGDKQLWTRPDGFISKVPKIFVSTPKSSPVANPVA